MLKANRIFAIVMLLCVVGCSKDPDDGDRAAARDSSALIADHLQRFPQCRHRNQAETLMFENCDERWPGACRLYMQAFATSVPLHLADVEKRLAKGCTTQADWVAC